MPAQALFDGIYSLSLSLSFSLSLSLSFSLSLSLSLSFSLSLSLFSLHSEMRQHMPPPVNDAMLRWQVETALFSSVSACPSEFMVTAVKKGLSLCLLGGDEVRHVFFDACSGRVQLRVRCMCVARKLTAQTGWNGMKRSFLVFRFLAPPPPRFPCLCFK